MSAETLRRAAERLRALIGEPSEESEGFTIPGPWAVSRGTVAFDIVPALDESYDVVAHSGYEQEARYIATMHPGVGLALAEWLLVQSHHVASRDCEAHCEYPDGCDETASALAVARLILGEAPDATD